MNMEAVYQAVVEMQKVLVNRFGTFRAIPEESLRTLESTQRSTTRVHAYDGLVPDDEIKRGCNAFDASSNFLLELNRPLQNVSRIELCTQQSELLTAIQAFTLPFGLALPPASPTSTILQSHL